MSIGIYRAYDHGGRLLYVGSSVNVEKRLKQHENTAPIWWMYHATIDIQWCETESEARATEAAAIASEHPRWNVEHRSTDHPDGFITTIQQASWLTPERQLANRVRGLRVKAANARGALRSLEIELRAQESVLRAVSEGALDFDDLGT